MAPSEPDYVAHADSLVGDIAARHGLRRVVAQSGAMGGWYVRYESDEFALDVFRERGGQPIAIALGSKVRRRPRAHMRGPWWLSILRGHLDGHRDEYSFESGEAEAEWLRANEATLFDTAFLNGEPLHSWAVAASRGYFGQRAR